MKRQFFRSPLLLTLSAISLALASILYAGLPAITETNSPPAASSPSLAPPLQAVDGWLLAIPKAGLGKDYQFAASIIPQELAATSTGLAGKIVRFEWFPDGVDMYESTRGLVVTEDLPARRLLATFPVVRGNDQSVVVDFNKGMRRVFTDEEQAYCYGRAKPVNHLAARFAAKEAISKCFTTGIGAELGWKSASIYHGTRLEPLVRLDEKGEALLRQVGATHVLISLSHTDTVAMAVAALVRV